MQLWSTVVVQAAPHCGLVPPKMAQVVAQSSSSTGRGSGSTNDVVATGWYPGWLGASLPPNKISWTKYGSLTFAFATTTPDPSVIALDAQSAALLPTFVTEAHANGVDAHLSIGGWTGSIYFSSAVNSAQNRTIFVQAIANLVKQYNLDGIDFDWEYPNKQGIGCNVISADDSSNFLLLLQEMNTNNAFNNIKITAAVGMAPFAGPDGTPMSDVSAFAKVIDHISIMDYDVWGSWSSSVGPNAPLDDTCASPSQQQGSAVSAIKAWTAAGFPANQIALGVAAYGHSFYVSNSSALTGPGALALYPPFDASRQPAGDSDIPGAPPSVDQCGNTSSGPGGTFNFNGMVDWGYLDANGNAASGMVYKFDNCSQTPFLYNPANGTMISYDDATSFAAKGHFINDNKLAGFAVWHIAGDSNDILLNAISDAMGIEQVCQ
ncbi:glycoside hydrolase family 18 protein [Panaeolus papilionaceus]|nr:glycoside hydrolase family 18 protein [Panaeolus papilionaceus]